MSLGQKQLTDLQETLQEDKEIYFFDEADNNLDEENKGIIEKKWRMLASQKIVIILSARKTK